MDSGREDMLQTIAGLRKEIEGLKSRAIKWIPIKERKPTRSGIYLVYDPFSYGVETDFWEIPSHRIPPRFSRLGETVTHWAELIPGPSED